MRSERKLTRLALTIVSTVATLSAAAPVASAQDFACIAYQHPRFTGESRGLVANREARRSEMSNKISGFKIRAGCHVDVFTEDNFKGPNTRFAGNVPYVGDSWNDVISSWKCVCATPRPVIIDR